MVSKEIKKQQKHDAILDAAESIMQAEGLSALSISKVAKQAKIAKGTVYLYFDSKEEIIGQLTIKARRTLLTYFNEYVGKHTDPLERIKAIFWADYYFFKEKYLYHQLVTFYEQNTGLAEEGELAQTSVDITSFLVELIEDAKAQGAIRQDINSLSTTFVFWGTVVGTLQIIETKSQQIEDFLQLDVETFYQEFVSFIEHALK